MERMREFTMRDVTCNNCGWVHFAVTRAYAQKQTDEFADFWDSSSIETKTSYFRFGAKPEELPKKYNRITHFHGYEVCNCCGESYKNFRESKVGDVPDGCTIGAILDYREYNDNEGL